MRRVLGIAIAQLVTGTVAAYGGYAGIWIHGCRK